MSFQINNLSIIGYGAMGKLLYQIALKHLSPNQISVYEKNQSNQDSEANFIEFKQLSNSDLIILAIPIPSYESVCQELSQLELKENAMIVSIAAVMTKAEEFLRNGDLNLILSHPLFGPASYKENNCSTDGFDIAISNFNCKENLYQNCIKWLKTNDFLVTEISPREHDQALAKNHFIPFFLSHVLKNSNYPVPGLLTKSGKSFKKFLKSTSYNLPVLEEIYQFNPYVQDELKLLNQEIEKLKDCIG